MRFIYVCSYCNRHHDSKPKALACESQHVTKPENPRRDYKYIEKFETYAEPEVPQRIQEG